MVDEILANQIIEVFDYFYTNHADSSAAAILTKTYFEEHYREEKR